MANEACILIPHPPCIAITHGCSKLIADEALLDFLSCTTLDPQNPLLQQDASHAKWQLQGRASGGRGDHKDGRTMYCRQCYTCPSALELRSECTTLRSTNFEHGAESICSNIFWHFTLVEAIRLNRFACWATKAQFACCPSGTHQLASDATSWRTNRNMLGDARKQAKKSAEQGLSKRMLLPSLPCLHYRSIQMFREYISSNTEERGSSELLKQQ